MNPLNDILQIPGRCLVHKKITKVFFKRNFELSRGEKTVLENLISIDWLASMSPSNANIPVYKDEQTIFEEVQVIIVTVSENDFTNNHVKIADLVQKYIPYPILLFIRNEQSFIINACDKKVNQKDDTKRTIEKMYFTEIIHDNSKTKPQVDFLKSLTFSVLDKTNQKTLYEAYIQRMIALQTASVKGVFVPRSKDRSQSDMENMEKIETLTKEIDFLQNQIKKESQLNNRVEMNMRIQEKRNDIDQLKKALTV